MTGYIILVAISLCLLSAITRLIPFLFVNLFKDNQILAHVGKDLPAYVMMLLVIYEIKVESFFSTPYALPALIALFLVCLVHVWKKQVLFSMLTGTISYVLMNYYLA